MSKEIKVVGMAILNELKQILIAQRPSDKSLPDKWEFAGGKIEDGEPHNGPDVLENLLCLCPNHHVLFDKGTFTVNEDFSIIGLSDYSKLTVNRHEHSIGKEFIEYHRDHCYIKMN